MTTAFISYSHKDRRFVRKLTGDLERLGVTVWVDEKRMTAGDSMLRSIRDGIDRSDHFLVVLSEHSVASEWVQREIDVASSKEIQGGMTKVVPILRNAVSLPALLEGKLFADFRGKYHIGLAAIRRALRLDERNVSVLVGVLLPREDSPDVERYLSEIGFSRQTGHWNPVSVDIEIASGYYSYLRGDHKAVGHEVSIFQPLSSLRVNTIWTRKDVLVVFGLFWDKGLGDRMAAPRRSGDHLGDGRMRGVLYILGPAAAVRVVIEDIRRDEQLPKGTSYDLEGVLKWWNRPIYLINAEAIVVEAV